MLRELLKEKSILLDQIEFFQDRYDGYRNLFKDCGDLEVVSVSMKYQQKLSILKQRLYEVNLLIGGQNE